MNNALRILLEDKYAAKCFLDGCIMRNKVPFIMEMFKDDLVTLKRMYLNTLETGFDRKGTLFWELYRTDPEIWKQYIDCLAEINYHEYYESSIIEHMWEQQEYKVNILYAFITLIEKQVFSRDKVIHMIFGRKENEYRKKEWLLSQLYKEDNCLERFKTLIYVVTVAYSEWEIEYVVKYLKINQSIEDFKRINLFPMMQSWTGSEIPLISRRIDFLLSLKNKINGLEYLDHKLYLDELINNEEKRKEEVELDEYIESFL